jgi:hypothetical protein
VIVLANHAVPDIENRFGIARQLALLDYFGNASIRVGVNLRTVEPKHFEASLRKLLVSFRVSCHWLWQAMTRSVSFDNNRRLGNLDINAILAQFQLLRRKRNTGSL